MNHGPKTACANPSPPSGWMEGFQAVVHARHTNESAPDTGGTPKTQPVRASGSDLGRLDVQDFAGARDRDRPRLHGLWDLAHEVDVQEPVRPARAVDLNIVGELEATLEGPLGYK
jgi:hypothetical protein